MEINMKGNGQMIKDKVMAITFGIIKINIKEIGKTIKEKDKVNKI